MSNALIPAFSWTPCSIVLDMLLCHENEKEVKRNLRKKKSNLARTILSCCSYVLCTPAAGDFDDMHEARLEKVTSTSIKRCCPWCVALPWPNLGVLLRATDDNSEAFGSC